MPLRSHSYVAVTPQAYLLDNKPSDDDQAVDQMENSKTAPESLLRISESVATAASSVFLNPFSIIPNEIRPTCKSSIAMFEIDTSSLT